MSIKNIIIAVSTFVVAFLVLVFVLSTGTEIKSPSTPSQAGLKAPEIKKTNSDFQSEATWSSRVPDSNTPAEPATEVTKIDPNSREAIMLKIQDAVATYSDEGVVVVEPLLSSPDLEIRESAIEAMKQISTPGAAESLRRVAKKSTTSPLEKKVLLDAATFIDLPPYQFKKKQ